MKVFLDANIFFAADRSPKGGSGFILELAKRQKIEIINVSYVLLEAERNIIKKLSPQYLNQHYQNLLETKPKIQSIEFVTFKEINRIRKLTNYGKSFRTSRLCWS